MGFFRGAGLFLVSILFIISILSFYSFATLSSSLEYETVQNEITPLIENLTTQGLTEIIGDSNIFGEGVNEIIGEDFNITGQIEENLDEIEVFCENNSGKYDLTEFGYDLNLEIPCDSIPENPEILIEDKIEIIINDTIHDLVEEIYYDNYSCDFWNCFGQEGIPYFLISQKAQEYWNEKLYSSLIICLILAVLMFLLIEKKINYPIVLGILILIPAIPFLKLISLLSFLDGFIVKILSIFLSKSYQVFWTGFIVGLVLIIFGILLYTVLAGTKIARWFKEKSVKKETENTPVKSPVKQSTKPIMKVVGKFPTKKTDK